MPRSSIPLAIVSAAIAFVFTAGFADAASDHTWVSTTGSGTTCTRSAPGASFQTAHDATNPGGVISVLDPGAADITVVTITKSILIRADGVDGGNTAANTSPSPWITVAAARTTSLRWKGCTSTAAASSSTPEDT